jgi:hypothetical protein
MTSARQYGKLLKTNWREDAWTALIADAQWLYAFLVSQPTTDAAGVFPIRISKWAKGAADMTVERVKAAAKVLAGHGWIVVDHHTEEGLIRTYIRDDWAGDNIFKGALGRATQAQSPRLRATLLYEIRNLGRQLKPEWLPLLDALEKSIPAGFDFGSVVPATPPPSSTATTQAFKRRQNAVGTPLSGDGESFAEGDRRMAQERG